MYVHSVKLVNFKSIGDYPEAEVILEPQVTAIIGQNESGKSNIIDGLSCIRFTEKFADAFNANLVNRNGTTGKENQYHIVLKPTEDDISFGINEETLIEIRSNSYTATGGILSYYLKVIHPNMETIDNLFGGTGANPFKLKDQDLITYRTYYSELMATDAINIPRRIRAFSFLKNRTEKLNSDIQAQVQLHLEYALSKWNLLVNRLPVFFYRKTDKHLKYLYKYEDAEKEIKNPVNYPNSLLSNFIKVIDVSNDDFLLAAKVGTSFQQDTVRDRIRRLVDSKINIPFQNSYLTEKVYLDIRFNSGVITFTVRSDNGESLSFSERSNGLRWYLETFIDTEANNIPDHNVVYLLDEPGISLHVNAQQQLLKHFADLANRGNQVVYTTHSPYMLNIDVEGIHRIRAVVKNEEGYSYIYKTAYDARIAPQSQKDTLTPIVNALGMNLQVTFGPANGKLNIVTEGMSDYIYMHTMAKQLSINPDTYSIIPSVGASNCANICSILHGWGCKYIALFDFDQEGVDMGEEHMHKKMNLEYGKQYCYVREVSQQDIEGKLFKNSPFMIEDVMTHSEINRFLAESKNSTTLGKPLTAKLMCTAIENKSFILSDESIENFKKLFNRIMSSISD